MNLERASIWGIACPYGEWTGYDVQGRSSRGLVTCRERFERRAFESCASWPTVLRLGHRGIALASVAAGTLRLADTDRGLSFSAEICGERALVDEVLSRAGASIADWQVGFERWDWNGPATRSVQRVTVVREIALVEDPAYVGARVWNRATWAMPAIGAARPAATRW